MRDWVFLFSLTFTTGYTRHNFEHNWEKGNLTTAELLLVTRYSLGSVYKSLMRKGHQVLKCGKRPQLFSSNPYTNFFNDCKPQPQKVDTNDGSKNRRRGRDTQEWRRPKDMLYTYVVFMVNLMTLSLPQNTKSRSVQRSVNWEGCVWHSEDRASWYILIMKPTRCTNFSNLFFE